MCTRVDSDVGGGATLIAAVNVVCIGRHFEALHLQLTEYWTTNHKHEMIQRSENRRTCYPSNETTVIIWQKRHVIRFAVFAERAWAHLASENASDYSRELAKMHT